MDEDDSGEISADEFVCSTELQQMFVSSVKFWNSDVSVYIYTQEVQFDHTFATIGS